MLNRKLVIAGVTAFSLLGAMCASPLVVAQDSTNVTHRTNVTPRSTVSSTSSSKNAANKNATKDTGKISKNATKDTAKTRKNTTIAAIKKSTQSTKVTQPTKSTGAAGSTSVNPKPVTQPQRQAALPQPRSQSKKQQQQAKAPQQQQQFVSALPPAPAQTVTASSDSSVQPSTTHTKPPAHLSSALGLGPQSRVHIDGFLSAGIAWTDSSANYIVPNHGTIDNQVNAAPLSLIGLQFTADLARHLQIVTQLVGDGDNTNGNVAYRVNVEWAFLRYAFNNNYQVQAGRFRLPAFLYSLTEQVGFSYPWVILPNEVYRIVPFNNVNGITFITRYPLSNTGWHLTVQPYYGGNKSQFTVYNAANPNGTTSNFTEDDVAGMVVAVGNKHLTLRGTYATLKLTGTFEGISPLIPSTTIFSKDTVSFYSAALKLMLGDFILIGEYANRDTPSAIAALAGYYGSVGFKFGKLTPLFTYAHIQTTNQAALNQAPALSEYPQYQQSYTLSLDYLLNSNLDIKGSVSQISPLNGTFGLFSSDPGRRQVYLYGLSLDAIF